MSYQIILLVVHILIAGAMIAVVLLQRSEGGALGIGGGGGGMMSARGKANVLTRTTSILAFAFFTTSITLAILARGDTDSRSVVDEVPIDSNSVIETPVVPIPGAGDSPSSVPVAPPEDAPASLPVAPPVSQ